MTQYIVDPRLVMARMYLQRLADDITSGRLSADTAKDKWTETEDGWQIEFGGRLSVPYDIVPRGTRLP